MNISLGKNWNTFSGEQDITGESGMSYEIGDQIDRGGNATVHECLNNDGELLAVKFLLSSRERIGRRFEQEITALRRINHPHIIQYVDHGTVNLLNLHGELRTIRFLIMDKAESNLLKYLRDHDTVGYEVYAPQFRGLCDALRALHGYAIHRDIKPENILIKGETWLLSDFGLCSYLDEEEHQDITQDNEKVGPKFWLSPEAINKFYFSNEEIGTFSDVYQLCSIFWFVLTHRHPTGILTCADWIDADPQIFNVIFSSLTHNRQNRPQNGKELFNLMCQATLGEV